MFLVRSFPAVGGMAHLAELTIGNIKSITKPIQQRLGCVVGSPEMGRREAEVLPR